MALSIQRTALILVITRIILVLFLYGVGTAITADQAIGKDVFNEKTQEKQFNLKEFFFSDGINIGGTYTDTKIGDEQYGFKMSFADVLLTGAIGWFPSGWATNGFERLFIYILSIFSSFLTAIALFEVFQIGWGKKTT